MSQVYPLDKVIRRSEEQGTAVRPAGERVVMIDARYGTHLPKKSFFSRADPRYYVVSTADDPSHIAKGRIAAVRLQDLEHTVSVSAEYQVRCRAGNEVRAAVSLFDDSLAPGAVLDKHLTRWIMELGDRGIPLLVHNYLADPTALAAKISARAMGDTGLDITVRLSLDAEEGLKTAVVSRDHLRVLVRDYQDEEQDLGFRITIEIDEAARPAAILQYHRSSEIEPLVVRELLRFFRQQVGMQTFCTELNSAAVRNGLAQHLDLALTPFGRKVAACRLTSKPSGLLFFDEGQHDIACKLHEYPTPIVISNRVQMTLKDVALYKASKMPPLKEWRQKKLEQRVHEELFSAQYIEVLIRFQKFEDNIRRYLDEEAAAIGYEIKQLITIPDLEPIKLKDPFTIDVTGTFETRLTNFHVKLQAVVTTRIANLESVEHFLNYQQNVPKLMEEAILAEARQYLHGTDPQRFYMRFNYADGNERTVEQELTEKIRQRLIERFRCEVIEVVLKVVDTEIIERLRSFQERICPFVVPIETLNGWETITFRGNFQVEGVDENGWHRFQLLTVGINDIGALLEEHIHAKLQAMPPASIQFTNPRDHLTLEKVLTHLAEKFVRDQFGLAIRVTNVRRDRTQQEAEATQKVLAERAAALRLVEAKIKDEESAETLINKAKVDQISKLTARRSLETDDTMNDDFLEELDRKIVETREGLAPASIPTGTELQRALRPGPGAMSLEQFAELSGMNRDAVQTPKEVSNGGESE